MPVNAELTQIERDKIEIDPDFDFRQIAQRPFADLTPNELGMFKWSGVYHQLQRGFFMIRLRLPGGLMTAPQLRRAADLAETYAQSQLCITTRQCLQFHWVRQADIHHVIDGMRAVGVLARNACGDVCRNVVSCPMAGVCPYELTDTLETVAAIADHDDILNRQRNLPRKHKISVAGCGRACAETLMNCQGWYPIRDVDGGIGWRFLAGGGLGARPYLAKPIFDWVPRDLLVPVACATVEAFRRHGNRRKRAWARLKIVVDRMGAEAFADLLLEILRETGHTGLERLRKSRMPAGLLPAFLDGQPVVPQKDGCHSTVRVLVRRSEMTADEARCFAGWAETYGSGTLSFTSRQNLQIRDVPDARVASLTAELTDAGLALEGAERLPDVVACVGTTVCNLAVADTPNVYRRMIDELAGDDRLRTLVGRLRINMNGCPNSCGQHWIADIGLRGMRERRDTGSVEGYSLYVGGALDGDGAIGQYVRDITAADVVPTLRRLLHLYLDRRRDDDETFARFAGRLGGAGVDHLLGSDVHSHAGTEEVNARNLRLRPFFRRVAQDACDVDRQEDGQ